MAPALGVVTWCVVASLGRRGLAVAAGLAVWLGYTPALSAVGNRIPVPAGSAAALVISAALAFAVRRELRWVLVTLLNRPELSVGMLGGLVIIRVSSGYALDHLGANSLRSNLGHGAGVAAALVAGAWLMSATARPGWAARAVRMPGNVLDRGFNAIDAGALARLLGTGLLLGANWLVLDRPAVASAVGVPPGWRSRAIISALLAALVLRAAAQAEKRDLSRRMRALVARQRRELDAQLHGRSVRLVHQPYAWYEEEV